MGVAMEILSHENPPIHFPVYPMRKISKHSP